MTRRQWLRTASNNPVNPNKNICVLAVAKALGADNETRYLHTYEDLVRALRTRYIVRSRTSNVKGKTVGKAREKLASLADDVNAIGFIVRVQGHVMLLDSQGKTIVDTDPRKRDKRKVLNAYVIYKG